MPRLLRTALSRLETWLGSPRASFGIVVVAIVVCLPSLGNGLVADDHWHKLGLTHDADHASVLKPWWELFTFYDGDAARTRRIVDLGLAPWWSDTSLAIAFFRPVSAATHAVDYALWPTHPWLMHAQSIAWYAALVAIAAWLYRRLLARPAAGLERGWVAGLAALLYAVDHTHGVPVAWVANRNALVAGAFALASLGAHDVAVRGRHRAGELVRERSLTTSLASALLFGAALGAGEGAIAVVAYFVAHAVFLDARAWRQRLGSLLPHAAVGCAWLVTYRAGGFGVRGSGLYIEPLREPAQFLAAVAAHLPLLVGAELGTPTSPNLYAFVPLPAKIAFVAIALLFVVWSASAALRLWRIDAVARFFVLGSLLGTLPACATFPAGRLLVVPGFGVIGLVALIGAGVASHASWIPRSGARRRVVRSFAIWACGGHLLLSPLALQIGMQQLPILRRILAHVGADLPAPPSPGLKRVILLDAPDTVFAPYLLLGRGSGEGAAPRMEARLLVLAGAARAADVLRTDEHTIVVRVAGGFYRTGTELTTRNEAVPMPVGTRVVLRDVIVEVLETASDGVPTAVSFRFEEAADAEAYVWEQFDGDRLVRVRPPPVGEHLAIPARSLALF